MKFVHRAYGIHKRVIIRFFYTHVAPLGLYPFVETRFYTPFVLWDSRPRNTKKPPQIRIIRVIRVICDNLRFRRISSC